MSTIETNRSWTHFRAIAVTPRYCHVTFDHPPINTITATTVAELSDLVGLIEQDPDLNVVCSTAPTGISTWPIMTWRTTPAGLRHSGSVPLDCRPGSTSLSVWLVPRWSASPRSGGAPAAPEASSCSPVICGSPSRENTLLGQWEVGVDVVSRGGPMARLSRLVGRGRAIEIPPRGRRSRWTARGAIRIGQPADPRRPARRGGRAIASRLARFDHDAIARTKSIR